MRSFVARPSVSEAIGVSGSAPFPLLVTTNKGLFLLHDGRWRRLMPVPCFGVARSEDRVYLGTSAGIHSFVLAARITGAPAFCSLDEVKILIRYQTRYGNERIHQIAFDSSRRQIVCANTRRNSLLIIDAANGKIVDEKFLFVDAAGFPIYTDQNHVNSVAPYGDALLFTAHSAGENASALGFIAHDRVRAYRYGASGAHDILIHDGGIMFTDSFRDALAAVQPNVSGVIRFRGDNYRIEATGTVPHKMVLRGLAARDGSLVVGYSGFSVSEYWRRHAAGGGGIVVIGADSSSKAIDGPFSQVYDILPFDGIRSDRMGAPCSVDELDCLFRRDVGPLLYEAPVARSARVAELTRL
jgi:hypothetical protein